MKSSNSIIIRALLLLIMSSSSIAFGEMIRNETEKLLALNAGMGDRFGRSVDIDGDIALVGAYLDDTNGSNSGAVYVYTRDYDGRWIEQTKLTVEGSKQFGVSVSLDGDTALIGANATDVVGAAFIFKQKEDGRWYQEAKLSPNNNLAHNFGVSVSISNDVAVIGRVILYENRNIDPGSAYVFNKIDGTWEFKTILKADDGQAFDYFGSRVSIYNNNILIGAPLDNDNGSRSGSAYIFARNNQEEWKQQVKLTASDGVSMDQFGSSVSINNNTVVIGAPLDDSRSGSAYIFHRNELGIWNQEEKLLGSDSRAGDLFGSDVSVAEKTIVVGAHEHRPADIFKAGSAYVFIRTSDTWNEYLKLVASDADILDLFGTSVTISGHTALVGAFGNSDLGGFTGSAYIFNLTEDADQDGVPDHVDQCPDSKIGDTIVIGSCDSEVENLGFDSGCTLADQISMAIEANGKKGLKRLLKLLKKDGILSKVEIKAIKQSNKGHCYELIDSESDSDDSGNGSSDSNGDSG